MGLKVRFADGAREGRVLAFDDEVERIVFGRDAARCQVVFPPDDVIVGREHCALERVLGRYRLVLNGTDAVRVNGRPAFEGQELADDARLQFGAGGPVVDVQARRNPRLAPTAAASSAERQLLGAIVSDLADSARRRWTIALVSLLLLASGGAAWWFLVRKGAGSQAPPAVAASPGSAAGSGPVDGRAAAGSAPTFASPKAPLDDRLAGLSERLGRRLPELRDAAREAAASVYRVVIRRSDGGETFVAMAFVVDPEFLATTARAARAFGTLPIGAKLVARPLAPALSDAPIQGARPHPAQRAYADALGEFEPAFGLVNGTLERADPAALAFDAGLLQVATGVVLGPVLPFLTGERATALAAGEPVGTVTADGQAAATAGRRISASTPLGVVTALSDAFGTIEGAPEVARLVVHHAVAASAADAGAPLVDSAGRVVGILGDAGFATSAEVLPELIEGASEGPSLAAREAAWTKRWKDRLDAGLVVKRDELLASIPRELGSRLATTGDDGKGSPGTWTMLRDQVLPLDAVAGSGERTAVLTPAAATGAVRAWLVVVAAGSRQPLGLRVTPERGTRAGAPIETSAVRPWLHTVLVEADGGSPPTVAISSTDATPEVRTIVFTSTAGLRTDASALRRARDAWVRTLSGERSVSIRAEDVKTASIRLAAVDGSPGAEATVFVTLETPGDYFVVAGESPGATSGATSGAPDDWDVVVVNRTLDDVPIALDRDAASTAATRVHTDVSGTEIAIRIVGGRAGASGEVRVFRAVPDG